MKLTFHKYHALGNDFIIIDEGIPRLTAAQQSRLAKLICARHTGVGADGVLFIRPVRLPFDKKVDVYNADGSWAEKSGNGLRIVGLHLYQQIKRRRKFLIEMGGTVQQVEVGRKLVGGTIVSAELPGPKFETNAIPMKSRSKHFINSPLKLGEIELPVTCLSVGNPHAVLIVDDFDFDWQTLGADIETHRVFPNRVNVEFVKIVNRKQCEVRLWERGVGETSSSGTGAIASVCAGVMLGLLDRTCKVTSLAGSVNVNWESKSGRILLSGPVSPIATGTYEFV